MHRLESSCLITLHQLTDASPSAAWNCCYPSKYYLDMYAQVGDPSSLLPLSPLIVAKQALRFHGGQIVDVLDSSTIHLVTHLIIDPADTARVSLLEGQLDSGVVVLSFSDLLATLKSSIH
jgi:hypothetical protein